MTKIELNDVDFSGIQNENAKRVVATMERLLSTVTIFNPNYLDYQDIYALALNRLPPSYRQKSTIVLQKSVSASDIEKAVTSAIEKVFQNPNHSDRPRLNEFK